ncbi:MAG: Bug family tripartite tricarboxylate transporter substrate binding protein [Gemmatimonas sp.]
MSITRVLAATAAVIALLPVPSSANGVEDFFRGKTVTYYISTVPGGGYDLYGRFVAQYIGKHIPGNPTLVPKNMPGAGGLTMTNWLYNVAPRDGTAIAGPPQALAIEQVLGSKGIQYDAGKFTYIGRAAPVVEVMYTWHTSKTKTFKDAQTRETIMGGTGPTSPTITYLKQLNVLAGTKFKAISGFGGTTEVNLAMERGEVEGSIKSWASMKVDNPDWLKEHKVNIILQFALDKPDDLPDVPLMMEIGSTEADSQALKFFAYGNAMGRATFAPPALPADRTAALRAAFMAMTRDPEFLAEAEKRRIDIGPLDGEGLQKIVAETLSVTPDVKARALQARQASE